MADNSLSLRILHISDLHFTSSECRETISGKQIIPREMLADEDEKKFLQNLTRFLEQFSEDQWPKTVIVSGDLVETGGNSPGEFDRAKQFLSDLAGRLRISDKKRIFIVPGNHDVSWYGKLELEERFKNYFNAVEEFSSPELLSRNRWKVHHEDLSNLVHGIALEVTLFISPTYSGVPDPTIIQQRVRELQDAVDENKISQVRLLDIAAIGAAQRSQIKKSNNPDKEPIRIAVLHHHLLPDNQLEVSQFESVVDAGRMLDELIANKYDLVLTGHKHNRRLVHLKNKNGAIDVYTSPSLFKDEGRGFTIIDTHDSTSSYYATLHYYDFNCNELLRQRLVREGRVLPEISEICADIQPPDQQKILLPVLESVRNYTKSAQEPPFENFFRGVWEQVSEDVRDIGQKRLVFRSPRIWEQWNNIIRLAQDRGEEIRLVSKNDLDYWSRARDRLSQAGKYSEPLRQFQGNKARILILDEPRFTYSEETQKCVTVIEDMIQQGFKVALVPLKHVVSETKQDFGIIGDFAVSTFEGQTDFTRSLKESFNEDDLKIAKQDWKILWQDRVWDSSSPENIQTFLERYTY